MSGLLVAGTSSDAGKSLVVTGLCRVYARRGIDVAPFKAQNMSNNSMVVRDGEIGRAQYLQATAAGVEPCTAMNPVLIKPGTDRRAHVVLRGRPDRILEAGQYATGRRHLASAAFDAFRELAGRHELVVCEGAGSPAEVNLRAGDYVNMGLARQFDLPVVLVGDIDRGGVLASIVGTWALLEEADRRLLKGYLINKFRGDPDVLAPGLVEVSRRTGLANFGVLDWLDGVWLDSEDALAIGGWGRAAAPVTSPLRVAVLRFPRVSNATDVDALAAEPGVRVEVTADPQTALEADLLVLPGTRATTDDLGWLRGRGLDAVVTRRHVLGRPVLGICGGYQMLGQVVADEVEGSHAGETPGLQLLPMRTDFGPDKVLGRPQGSWQGHPTRGYEIHHGIVTPVGASAPAPGPGPRADSPETTGGAVGGQTVRDSPGNGAPPNASGTDREGARSEPSSPSGTSPTRPAQPPQQGTSFPPPATAMATAPAPEPFLDGFQVGTTWGTLWHGALEQDGFRRAWLTRVAQDAGHPWRPAPGASGYAERREQMIDTLADALEAQVDVDALLALARSQPHRQET